MDIFSPNWQFWWRHPFLQSNLWSPFPSHFLWWANACFLLRPFHIWESAYFQVIFDHLKILSQSFWGQKNECLSPNNSEMCVKTKFTVLCHCTRLSWLWKRSVSAINCPFTSPQLSTGSPRTKKIIIPKWKKRRFSMFFLVHKIFIFVRCILICNYWIAINRRSNVHAYFVALILLQLAYHILAYAYFLKGWKIIPVVSKKIFEPISTKSSYLVFVVLISIKNYL